MSWNRRSWAWRMNWTIVLALALAGCNSVLHGTWKTEPVPQDAPFYIIEAQFKEDDTFKATARKGEDLINLRGTYDFDGFRLKLKRPGKTPDRVYGATCIFGKTLKLRHDKQRFTMKKQ